MEETHHPSTDHNIMNASPTPLIQIPIACVFPSPFNAERSKRYSKFSLQDLADNLAQHGQIEPAIVRRRPGSSDEESAFELVVGERRWRACSMAGINLVDAIVRDLTDRQVCDIMLSENLQRENLKPVEEACVFSDMLKAHDGEGHLIYETIEDLTRATGKNARAINHRIKLLNCPDFLLEAIDAGLVPARSGELIGRVPNAKRREEAARRAMKSKYREGPMTVKEVIEMLETEFMVSLKGCGFALDDAELDGEAGPCTTCAFRSGNDPEMKDLFSDPCGGNTRGGSRGFDPNVCLNPDCLVKKQGAAWRMIERSAEAAGHRVMPATKGKLMLAGWDEDMGVFTVEGEKYIAQDGRPGHEHTGHFGNDDLPTWEELLQGAKPSWIIVKDGRRPRYFLESEVAVECVEAVRAGAGMARMFKKHGGKGRGQGAGGRENERGREPVEDAGRDAVMLPDVDEPVPVLKYVYSDEQRETLRQMHDRLVDVFIGDECEAQRLALRVWFARTMLYKLEDQWVIHGLADYFDCPPTVDELMLHFAEMRAAETAAFSVMILVHSLSVKHGRCEELRGIIRLDDPEQAEACTPKLDDQAPSKKKMRS